jgi:diguanylate cyclase (GGDEF)-like protein/PAS domain S-box-containing protein
LVVWMRASLRQSLISILLLDLFVFGLVGFVLLRGYQQDHDKAVLLISNLSRVLDEELSDLIDRTDLTLLSVTEEIAREERSGGLDRRTLESFLARQDAQMPYAIGVRVAKADELSDLADLDFGGSNGRLSDRDYFLRLRDDANIGLAISKPMIERRTQKQAIVLARRWNGRDGSFAGIVLVSVPVDSLSAVLSSVNLGPHGEIALYGSGPVLMAYHSLDSAFQTNFLVSAVLRDLIRYNANPTVYEGSTGMDGFQRLSFFRKVDRWPLYLAVGAADKDFLADWRIECAFLGGLSVLFMLGSILAAAKAFGDTKRRAQTESALRAAELRYRTLAAGSFDGIVAFENEKITDVNDQYLKLLGYDRDELIGRTFEGLFPLECRELMLSHIRDGEVGQTEHLMLRKDGSTIIVESRGQTMDIAGRKVRLWSIRDITSVKEYQKQLESMAHYDALTGLPNRVLAADRLRQALLHSKRHKRSLALAYLDLDGFKSINDRFGHNVGDGLLIALSMRMKAVLRENDTLARIGGDEFVVILGDLEQPRDCEAVISRLLAAANDSVSVDERILQVSASIGVTLYPQDGADAEQLLRHADQAMYVAKQAGKNRFHIFDVTQETAVKNYWETIEDIRRALDRDEFRLHYQPKVNMRTGEVVGAEALIRWRHPKRGLLSPATFLPAIEDHPIGLEVGDWVIDRALTQMTEWLEAGLALPVSVNVGARQLQQDSFVPRLRELLAAHPHVSPDLFELEILETSALEDFERVNEVMLACHAIGVGFALDDFGTGYSSLTYLKRLRTGTIKIDQSFVRGILLTEDDRHIVRAIVDLGKAFNCRVIAEGVETVEHGEILLSYGCMLAQGYGIARPMPAADVLRWVATWRPDAAWKRSRPLPVPTRLDRMHA